MFSVDQYIPRKTEKTRKGQNIILENLTQIPIIGVFQQNKPKPAIFRIHHRHVTDLQIGTERPIMRSSLRTKAIAVCNDKIAKKGETVGLSFYAFFANRNDDPEQLMEAAEWRIKTHELDYFEKAVKIREMIISGA